MKKLFTVLLTLVSLSAFAADGTFDDHVAKTKSLFKMLSDGTNHPNKKLGKRYSNKVCELAYDVAARNVGYQLLFIRLGFDEESKAQLDQVSNELDNVRKGCKKRLFSNNYRRLKLKNVGGMMYDSFDALKGLKALEKKALDAGMPGVQGMIDFAMWAQREDTAGVSNDDRIEEAFEPTFETASEAQSVIIDA